MTISRASVLFLRRHSGLLSVLALCAGVGTAGDAAIKRHFASSIAAAEQSDAALASAGVLALGQQVERTLDAVGTLQTLGQLLHAEGVSASTAEAQLVRRYLADVIANRRFTALQLALIDAEGWLMWSTLGDFRRVDLSDREHFRVHRDGRREPFVSAPLVGRATGQWSIQFTWPLLDGDGRFDGVVVVSVDPFELSAELEALRVNERATVTLMRVDGIILARNREPRRFVGTSAAPETLQAIRESVAEAGMGTAMLVATSLTGVRLQAAVRRVAEWPLLIAVGVDSAFLRADALARRQELQLALAMSLVLLLGSGWLIDEWRARRSARVLAARAEHDRKQLLDFLEALPGATYRGVLAADGSWLRLEVSSGLARLARTDDNLCDTRVWLAHDRGRTAAGRARFRTQILNQGEAVSEYPLPLPSGRTLWLRDQARLVGADDQDAVVVAGILTNITEELQLRAKATEAAKLATLGEMATGVAHELSQPAAAIGLAADLAALEAGRIAPSGTERLHAVLDDIAVQTTRMREIIDHFRIFARTESPDEGRFHPANAVRGALAIVRGTLSASGVQVETSIAADLPDVRGRLVPFEQVLVNLLINARDAMATLPQDARRVQVGAEYHTMIDRVVMTVRDFGPGVPHDLRDRVFEPFFTTKPPGQGTGLGLSIAHGIVRSAGGTIEIANHRDTGAVVTLALQPDRGLPLEDARGGGVETGEVA